MTDGSFGPAWDRLPDSLRERGLRWTTQRATLLTVLRSCDGHMTGSQLVERCREIEPATTPSTVYRTLAVLESLGVISHSHGLDGREAFHVAGESEHAHLICTLCGRDEELPSGEAAEFVEGLRRDRGFMVRMDHLSVAGRCRACSAEPPAEPSW